MGHIGQNILNCRQSWDVMYERRTKDKNGRQAEKPETIIFKIHLSGKYSEFGFPLVFNAVTH